MSKSTLSTIKPLKGLFFDLSSVAISNLSADNINLSSNTVELLLNGKQLDGTTIINSQIDNSIIGINNPSYGFFTMLTAFGNTVFYSTDKTKSVSWNALLGVLTITGNVAIDGCATIGNLQICKNTISAINTNGDIIIKPSGIGGIYLNGPLNNVSTYGSYVTSLANGSVTFLSSDYIHFTSLSSNSSITTFSDQTYTTANGDIIFNTDSSLTTKNISNIKTTNGNILITTTLPSSVRIGDMITITNSNSTPTINGKFTVTNILDSTHFNISTSNAVISQGNFGTFIKDANNSIYLNASETVSIPKNIPLLFGTNYISGNTTGFLINSQGDIIFTLPQTNKLQIPQNTKIQLGTSSNNYMNFDGQSINLQSYNDITMNASNGYFNINDVFFSDQNPYIANYEQKSTDISDRGIQFSYWDGGTGGSMKLGWFGYKENTHKFTFLTNAVNINEVITGDHGGFELGSIALVSGGSLDVSCGEIKNVNLITGCGGTININGSTNINISTGSRLALISGGDIYIPNKIPITLGTNGSYIKEDTGGNLILTGSTNMLLNGNSVIIQPNTKISFDGTSIGNQSIFSTTSGNLNIKANQNLFLTTTGGNIIIPQAISSTASSIQFGETSQTIYGNTSGIFINSFSSSGSLNFTAMNNINITNSVGNILLNSNGDIDLFSSSGNIRLNTGLVFGITGTSNSIKTDSIGNLKIYGSASNIIELKNIQTINLTTNTGGTINIPNNVQLNFGTTGNIITDTSANFNITNNYGNTNINTQNLSINGTSGTFNLTHVYFNAQNPNFANYTQFSSDQTDRGFLYNYWSSNISSASTGWFGYKQATRQFTFYQDAINNNDVITGTLGSILLGSINVNSSTIGNIDLACGTISNLNTITGCHGIVNILATSSTNICTSNLMLNTNLVQIPYNTSLAFGSTSNSIIMNSSGNMTIKVNDGTGTLILNSNVQINGTTNNVYTTVTNYEDPIITIGNAYGSIITDLKDRGIEFKWNATTAGSSTGFFGFQNSTNRFVYYNPSINTNQIISGTLGDVQFGNGYFSNLDVSCGTIANVSVITACASTGLNIISTSGINLSTSNIYLPNNTALAFGTSASISTSSGGGIILNMSTSGNGFVQLSQNSSLYLGTGTFLTSNSTGDFIITNTSGNILLNPKTNVIIPANDKLVFGNTATSISGNGSNLQLNGYSIGFNSTTTITFNGDVNVIGKISSSDKGSYIYPLGTSEQMFITSIINSITSGNRIITTSNVNYLGIGDSVILKNTDSIPLTDGTFIVNQIISPTQFSITAIQLTSNGTTGVITTSLKTYRGKDIGLELDFWQNDTGNGITSGSAYYKTGFLGRQYTSGNLVYYQNANITDNIVTSGTLGNMLLNTLYTNILSGQGNTINLQSALNGTSGSSIDNIPIGQTTPQSGKFTNVNIQNNLIYGIERILMSNLNLTQNPSVSIITTYITTFGATQAFSGTMGSSNVDGQIKKIIISGMGNNCFYNLHFPPGTLIAPNPLGTTILPSNIKFKRQGQSVELMWNAQAQNATTGAWQISGMGGGCYVS